MNVDACSEQAIAIAFGARQLSGTAAARQGSPPLHDSCLCTHHEVPEMPCAMGPGSTAYSPQTCCIHSHTKAGKGKCALSISCSN